MKRILSATIAIFVVCCVSACTGVKDAQAVATLPTDGLTDPATAAMTEVPAFLSLSPSPAVAVTAPVATATQDIIILPKTSVSEKATVAASKAASTASVPAAAMAAAAPDVSALINAEAQKYAVKAAKYYGGFSSNHYKFTAAELKMLAIVIHMEARGEPYKAKLAVGNVVMNRVLASGYPGSTIKAVVTRPNQFCYRASVTPTAECMKAARDVLENEVWVVPQNTYFFRCTGSKANWGRHKYWGHIDSTAFYQDNAYAGRSNTNAIPAKLFDRVYQWPQYGCKPAARVRKVQAMLNGLGYKVTADGWFGLETRQALISFQKAHGLAADGVAGPATLRRLIAKYGWSRYLKL